MTKKRTLLSCVLAGAYCLMPTAQADERASRFYEDDAWYDISEWFDGNDYNPTDEAIGRWDNETFEYSDNLSSSDQDNDSDYRKSNWGDYGYSDRTPENNRWFYDYYDDGQSSWKQDDSVSTYTVYRDSNDDGVYDSFNYYTDTDGDGVYDDVTQYSFDKSAVEDQKARSEARDRQKEMSSRKRQVSGTIARTKMVDVRGKLHLVAHVDGHDGKTMIVDLGPQQGSTQLFEGDQLTATGHEVKVGEKSILIASEAKSKSSDLQIDRNGRKFSGKVASTREAKIQGQTRLLAKVQTDNGKSMMVDLGPKDELSDAPSDGDKITVQGVPVKVNERIVLMARTLERDGDETNITRRSKNSRN